MPRWLRYFISGLATLLAILACCGAVYEQIERRKDARAGMPGELVDVGGYRMHIVCEGSGSPTILLDSGLGDNWLSWRKVQPAVAQFTRVCSYDRAGMGFSAPSPKPRTSEAIAGELHALLERTRIAPPYVVVGHSWGGLNVRMFTSLYRAEVVGMVLVDSSHPDQMRRMPPEVMKAQDRADLLMKAIPYLLPLGMIRYAGACGDDAVAREAGCRAESFRESSADMKAFVQSSAEVRATGSLGDLPLIVLSHDPKILSPAISAAAGAKMNQLWEELQEDLRHLSTRGSRQVVDGATHYIQLDRPEVVIDAIHRLWEGAR